MLRVPTLRDARGAAFMEFLICIPFLLILLTGILEIGQALNTYLTLSRVVYEASRYACALGNLESGGPYSDPLTLPPGHGLIRSRVNLLLNKYKIDPAQVTVSSQRFHTAGEIRDQVKIKVTLPVPTLFPVPPKLASVSSEVTGPYLFVTSATSGG